MDDSTCSWHSETTLVMWFGCHGSEVQAFQNDMSLEHLFDLTLHYEF